MTSSHPTLLKTTLYTIALVQALLGLAFLLAPQTAAELLGLALAPGWVNWLLGMLAARSLGYAYGMLWAAAHPGQARSWIGSMAAVQALDWLVTVKYLALGAVSLAQVSTASFLPLLFIVALFVGMPRSTGVRTLGGA